MADKLTLDKHDMKNPATVHLRIYVGGLTDDVTIEDIYNHFIMYGQIDGIIINRVFGFVQFREEPSVQKAISNANLTMLQGKKITVRTAQRTQGKRESEIVVIKQDIPPAVALTDNIPGNTEAGSEDPYDNFGNYVPDRENYREEDYEEGYNNMSRSELRGGLRDRGRGRGRGRGAPPGFRERSPGRKAEWQERSFDRYPLEYPRALPVPERNDCEIIVVAKSLTEYAEYIEGRLKRLGIVVDLLFPMEDVPIGKVLGNIASRGCLYAILVMPLNLEHKSLTLTILHGLPQEHRNMPIEDALQLLSRNFQEVQRGGPSGREAVYALLGQLADGQTLTVLQYDKVIEYLQERREQQVKLELGEPSNNKTQVDLQQRILSILNNKKSAVEPTPPAPHAVSPPVTKDAPTKLFSDPTVRKALDSILQKFI